MEDSTSSTLSLSIHGSLSAIALGIVDYFFCKNESSNGYNEIGNNHIELKEYEQMANEVYTEKNFIANKLAEITTKQDRELSHHRYNLFASNSVPAPTPSEKTLELLELIDHLCNAMNTYPNFIINQSDETSYITSVYRELEEHHMYTK